MVSGFNHYADQDCVGGQNCSGAGKRPARTAGYCNDDDALKREFWIDLEPKVSESARGSRADLGDALGGVVESALSGQLADAWEQVGESDREDLGDCVITTQ